MEPIETIRYKRFDINICYDEDPLNPIEEFDFMGTMVCFSRKYTLGHKHNYRDYWEALYHIVRGYWLDNGVEFDENELEEMGIERLEKEFDKCAIFLPLYIYDHSGVMIRTYPFSCPWDSGRVGFIYVRRDNPELKMYDDPENKAREIMEGEVELYDDYLAGCVYGYTVTNREVSVLESSWGYYGCDMEKNGLPESAKTFIDNYVEERKAQKGGKIYGSTRCM